MMAITRFPTYNRLILINNNNNIPLDHTKHAVRPKSHRIYNIMTAARDRDCISN